MKFKLEIEDEERPFAGWAFLLFRNADPGFLFVDRLNRLYDYAFERIGDMELSGVSWPFYYFDDESNGLKYFLLQRPQAATDAPWSPMDKLLLVRGERAGAVAEAICDDFADSVAPDPADILAVQRMAIIEELQAAFTFVTQLDFDIAPSSRSAAKERALVEDYCNKILSNIEALHLDLSRAERLRIELEQKYR